MSTLNQNHTVTCPGGMLRDITRMRETKTTPPTHGPAHAWLAQQRVHVSSWLDFIRPRVAEQAPGLADLQLAEQALAHLSAMAANLTAEELVPPLGLQNLFAKTQLLPEQCTQVGPWQRLAGQWQSVRSDTAPGLPINGRFVRLFLPLRLPQDLLTPPPGEDEVKMALSRRRPVACQWLELWDEGRTMVRVGVQPLGPRHCVAGQPAFRDWRKGFLQRSQAVPSFKEMRAQTLGARG